MEHSNTDKESNQKLSELTQSDFESIVILFKMLKEERDYQSLINNSENK